MSETWRAEFRSMKRSWEQAVSVRPPSGQPPGRPPSGGGFAGTFFPREAAPTASLTFGGKRCHATSRPEPLSRRHKYLDAPGSASIATSHRRPAASPPRHPQGDSSADPSLEHWPKRARQPGLTATTLLPTCEPAARTLWRLSWRRRYRPPARKAELMAQSVDEIEPSRQLQAAPVDGCRCLHQNQRLPCRHLGGLPRGPIEDRLDGQQQDFADSCCCVVTIGRSMQVGGNFAVAWFTLSEPGLAAWRLLRWSE